MKRKVSSHGKATSSKTQRLGSSIAQRTKTKVDQLLARVLSQHPSFTGGASVAVIDSSAGETRVIPSAVGFASRENKVKLTTDTWLEHCSLSKTLAAAFAIEFFGKRGIPLSAKVAPLLSEHGSPLSLRDNGEGWADRVRIRHLMNHTALGMHYVKGTPLGQPVPSCLDVLYSGAAEVVSKAPGTAFAYSGGGFLVLQHLLELISGQGVVELFQPWLTTVTSGAREEGPLGFSFCQHAEELSSKPTVAVGYRDDHTPVEATRLMFPALCAGGLGTPSSLAHFLCKLARAYHGESDPGEHAIKPEQARSMLEHTQDLGAFAFMQAEVGLGVFVARAGENRFMLHQAANDGFRGLYLVCFDGPAYREKEGPSGVVLLSNGDDAAVPLNCQILTHLLRDVLCYSGFDWSRVKTFDSEGVAQEQVVNLALKETVLLAMVHPLREGRRGDSTVVARPLEREAFKAFGEAVMTPSCSSTNGECVNQGTAAKHPWLANIVNGRLEKHYHTKGEGAVANVSVFSCQPRSLSCENGLSTFTLSVMERHPYSSQLFVPMGCGTGSYIVLVAEGKGAVPDLSTLRAFRASGGQAINYKPGVWHSPMVVVGEPMRFVCLTHEDGSPEDCEVVELAYPVTTVLPCTPPATEAHTSTMTTTTTPEKKEEKEEEGARMMVAPMAPMDLASAHTAKEPPQWSELTNVVCGGIGGHVLFASDDWFAAAECLLSSAPPIFIPGKFTHWGKLMDGWESRRKRVAGHDYAIIALAKPSMIYGFEVDSAFFTGNQAPRISIQAASLASDDPRLSALRATRPAADGGFAADTDALAAVQPLKSEEWTELVPQTNLRPGYEDLRHHFFDVVEGARAAAAGRGWTHLRFNIFPDGGVARLRARGVVLLDSNEGKGKGDEIMDLAAALNGGVAIGASNAHYGRASNLIAPGRAKNMGEGWETARNPNRPAVLEMEPGSNPPMLKMPPEHVDWAILRLRGRGVIQKLEIDTNHFKGNCPESCLVEGAVIYACADGDLAREKTVCCSTETTWMPLLPRTRLTPHNRQYFELSSDLVQPTHLRIKIYPDGGVSRLRAFGRLAE